MSETVHHIPASELTRWVADLFVALAMPPSDAANAAEMLVQTSLWGIDSHGVARVPHYLERLSRGSIVAQPRLDFRQSGAATGDLDGAHGLGFVVCRFATEQAIALARNAGVGVVGVRNSSHCGAIGLYTRQMTAGGMIGIAFTHSDSFVVPHGGSKPFFGTNPISIAIPTAIPGRPFCVDMATSKVPWNRIMNARRQNTAVDPGLGVDSAGRDSTNPNDIVALKPLGEHKGYALAFAIDMLCGPLNGMNFGPHLSPMYSALAEHRRLGSLMIAIDPNRFFGGGNLAQVVAAAIAEVRSTGSEVLTPGEPEYLCESKRRSSGIPLDSQLYDQFRLWSEKLSIPVIRPPTLNV